MMHKLPEPSLDPTETKMTPYKDAKKSYKDAAESPYTKQSLYKRHSQCFRLQAKVKRFRGAAKKDTLPINMEAQWRALF